jgi:hypothetical protein
LIQTLGGLSEVFLGGVNKGSEIEAQMGLKKITAVVNIVAKDRFGSIELESHVWILRSLTGEHKDHGTLPWFPVGREDGLRIKDLEGGSHIAPAIAQDYPTMIVLGPPNLQRVSDVFEVRLRVLRQMLGQICRHFLESDICLRRQDKQLPGPSAG